MSSCVAISRSAPPCQIPKTENSAREYRLIVNAGNKFTVSIAESSDERVNETELLMFSLIRQYHHGNASIKMYCLRTEQNDVKMLISCASGTA